MYNGEKSKKSKIIKIFLMTLFVFMSFFASQMITYQFGHEKINTIYAVDFDDNMSNSVSTLSSSDNQYSVSGDTYKEMIGGKKITFRYDYNSFYIDFNKDPDGNDGNYDTITIYPHSGYRLTKVKIGNNCTISFSYSDSDGIFDESIDSMKDSINSAWYDEIGYFTPEALDPTYTGSISIEATTEEVYYQVFMYEDSNGNGNYKEYATSFSVSRPANIRLLDPGVKKDEYEFSAWVMREDLISEYGYTKSSDVNNKLSIYSKYGGSWTIEYAKVIYNIDYGTNLYYVTSIYGYDDFGKMINTDPLIFAKWSLEYDVTIDNSSAIMSNKTNENGQYLAGAYSHKSGGITAKTKSTTANITIRNGYTGYKFLSSAYGNTGTSFNIFDSLSIEKSVLTNLGTYLSNTSGDEWYYLYNYGYYISSWTIMYTTTDGRTGWFTYNNGVWGTTDNKTDISIYNFTTKEGSNGYNKNDTTNTAYLAYCAQYCDGMSNGTIDIITMTPNWTPVEITVQSSGNTIGKTKYNDTYSLNIINKTGQSLTHYVTSQDKHTIVLMANWTYVNITEYVSNSSTANLYDYTLSVDPVYVNNIYKINLNNIYKDREGNYTLDEEYTKYRFSDLDYDANQYTYMDASELNIIYDFDNDGTTNGDDIGDVVGPYEYGKINFSTIEEYAGYWTSYITHFDGLISNQSLELFSKVFGKDNLTETTDTYGTRADGLYIYLANDSPIDSLPIFKRSKYSLVAWNNENANEKLYYKTNLFDDTIEYTDLVGTASDEWKLEQGYYGTDSNPTVSWTPYYFINTYLVDVRTILNHIGLYGYLMIDIYDHDTNEHEYYLGVYDSGIKGVRIYESEDEKVTNLTTFNFNVPSYYYDEDDLSKAFTFTDEQDIIITAYDQSKAQDTVKSGQYDCMIGFKYASTLSQCVEKGYLETSTEYETTVSYEIVDQYSLKSGDLIEIDVKFTYIDYNLIVAMEDVNGKAGFLSVNNNMQSTIQTLKDVRIDNEYNVHYYAKVGFELEENPIRLNNASITFDDYIPTTADGMINQDYNFTISGTWLRLYHYGDKNPDYSLANLDIGTMNVYTQAIKFNYQIKVFDGENDIYNLDADTLANECSTTFSLNERTAQYTLPSIIDTNIHTPDCRTLISQYEGMYIFAIDDVRYAILNTRLFNPKAIDSTKDNYYTEYTFPLVSESELDNDMLITSTELAIMVITLENGQIVPKENRTVYTLMEVREMYDITTKLDIMDHDYQDVNTRSTTISNTTKDIEYSKTLSVTGRYHDESMIVYTYMGLENTITSEYDSRYYTGVDYFIDGVEGYNSAQAFSSPLIINKLRNYANQPTLTIKYVPIALPCEVTYSLDGETVTQETLISGGYIDNIELPKGTHYYRDTSGQVVKYKITNPDYIVKVTNNGSDTTGITDDNIQYTHNIQVTNQAYLDGKLKIHIDVSLKDTTSLSVRYMLYTDGNVNKLTNNEEYGDITILVENNEVSGNSVNVIAGKSVDIVVDIATGYIFYGIQRGTKPINKSLIVNDGDRINITNNYSHEEDGGEYTIYLQKVDLTASLDTSNSALSSADKARAYTLSYDKSNKGDTSSGATGLYVGKTITLKAKEQDTEVISGNFYYYDKYQTKCEIDTNTVDGVATAQILVTSELLDMIGKTNLEFGFDVEKKVKLDILIVGKEFASEISITTNGEEYKSGTYVLVGTNIDVKVESVDRDKYRISTAGAHSTNLEYLDIMITMRNNNSLTITIAPIKYTITKIESVYDNLDGLNSNTPTIKTTNTEDINYLKSFEYTIGLMQTNQEMHTLTITGNNTSTVTISFSAGKVKSISYVDTDGVEHTGETLASLVALGYEASIKDGNIVIKSTIEDSISFNATYIEYRNISPIG